MPLCGFNKKMLDGLELFSEGLWDQAIKRSREDNLSQEDSLNQEIKEIDLFDEILATKDPQKFQGLRAVAQLAKVLYSHALEGTDHKMKYDHGFKRERKLYQDVDAKYYDEFRPTFGPEEGLRKLGGIIQDL